MAEEERELLLHFFKVLSDSNRLKLLGLLATKTYSFDELATLLKTHGSAKFSRITLRETASRIYLPAVKSGLS